MKKQMTLVLGVMLMAGLCGMVVAGSMDSPGLPLAGSGMYSIEQTYDYLNSGTVAPTPGPFQEPSGPPGPTMKTMRELYDDMKAKFDECPVAAADVRSGVKFFCTQPGSWGVQTGTLSVLPIPTATPTITPTPTWSCGTAFTDSRDNKVYNTVQIGTTNAQCWMKENLNVGTYIDGSANQTSNSVVEKWCYNNDLAKCTAYGGLYTWDEAMQYVTTPGVQGICPTGWHIPTFDEFCTLDITVDSSAAPCVALDFSKRGTDAGTKLKVGGVSGWEGKLSGARDETPNSWMGDGVNGYKWTSTLGTYAYMHQLTSSPQVNMNWGARQGGTALRCIKN